MKSFIIQALVLVGLVFISFVVLTGARTFGSKASPMTQQPPENVTVRLLTADGSLTDPSSVPTIVKSEEEWRARLTPEQYAVARSQGTERPFCGIFHDNHKAGVYSCVGCGLPLFRSDAKFDSGTDGQVSFNRSPRRTLQRKLISAMGWFEVKSIACAVEAIWATCLRTVLLPPACGIVSIQPL